MDVLAETALEMGDSTAADDVTFEDFDLILTYNLSAYDHDALEIWFNASDTNENLTLDSEEFADAMEDLGYNQAASTLVLQMVDGYYGH